MKAIHGAFLLLLLLAFAPTCRADDGFESVTCGGDIPAALVGKKLSSEADSVIATRHRGLALKDLGGDVITDDLFLSPWSICGNDYLLTLSHSVVRDVLKMPARSKADPEFDGDCRKGEAREPGTFVGTLVDSPGSNWLQAKTAWKLDEETGKFSSVPVDGLTCARHGILFPESAGELATAPKGYPDFDRSKPIAVSVLIARLAAGGVLPDLAECHQTGVMCIDPPAPFWLDVRVERFLHGPLDEQHFAVVTTGFQGVEHYRRSIEPYILVVESQGRDHVMPRFAEAPAIRNGEGKYYMLLTVDKTPRWLPCAVETLREPLRPADFPDAVHYFQHRERFRKQTGVYETTDGVVFPKFGIPLDALSTFLDAMHPSPGDMRCESH